MYLLPLISSTLRPISHLETTKCQENRKAKTSGKKSEAVSLSLSLCYHRVFGAYVRALRPRKRAADSSPSSFSPSPVTHRLPPFFFPCPALGPRPPWYPTSRFTEHGRSGRASPPRSLPRRLLNGKTRPAARRDANESERERENAREREGKRESEIRRGRGPQTRPRDPRPGRRAVRRGFPGSGSIYQRLFRLSERALDAACLPPGRSV